MSNPEGAHWTPFGGKEHQQSLGKRADIVFGPDAFDPRMELHLDSDPAMEAMQGAIAADALPYTKTIEDLEKSVGELYGTADPDELRIRIQEENEAFDQYLASVTVDKT